MTPDRAQRLESLGFIWATKDPRHVPWDQRLQELVAFKKKYGVSFHIVSNVFHLLLLSYCTDFPKVTYVLSQQSQHCSVPIGYEVCLQ